MNSSEPIAAISTPYGRGGIAVIRLSGNGVLSIADRFFHAANGTKICESDGNKTLYGRIYHNGNVIDDGIAAIFRAPRSFTGEDTVEISCHGGIVLAKAVLDSAINSGCRYATAGEFTKRAFLNGKLGLLQAEAVMGLIDAVSEEGIKLSSAQSRGVLSKKIEKLKLKLIEIISSVYAYIDYPDEDLTDMTVNELLDNIISLSSDMKSLLDTYKIGKAVSEGIVTVIAGKPNTGKSSVLNRILGKERAIVTSIAGTTRDTVEETVNIGKVTLRLCDTAGIHGTDDTIEKIGVERTINLIKEAELILAVFDSSNMLDDEDRDFIDSLKNTNAEIIPIINKNDLKNELDLSELQALGDPIYVSAKTGEGFDNLSKKISDFFVSEKIDYNTMPVIANSRQYESLKQACEHLEAAKNTLLNGFTQDVAGFDLEMALEKLGDIDGSKASEEITNNIFSRFCIGK